MKASTGHSSVPTAAAHMRPLLAVLALTLTAGLAQPGLALASTQRGHTYTATFGASGEGALSDPGQLALSNANGDVYVLDRGHDRIVQYGPHGEFLSTWGWGVKNGAWEYETCTTSCQAGVPGRGEYQLNPYVISIAVDNCTTPAGTPCSKAEDPSVGDLYVLKEYAFGERKHSHTLSEEELELAEQEQATGEHAFSEDAAIDKFSPTGQPLKHTRAVDYHEGELEGELELETEDTRGLTVAPDGTPWLYYQGEMFTGEGELFALANKNLSRAKPPQRFVLPAQTALGDGLAVDAAGGFYTGYDGRLRLPILTRAPAQVHAMALAKWTTDTTGSEPQLQQASPNVDGETITALTVADPDASAAEPGEANDLYLATHAGITQLDQQGQPLDSFGEEQVKDASGVAVNPASTTVYATDPAAGTVDVFDREEVGPPRVTDANATAVTASSVALEALIAPADTPTSYAFRYSTGALPQASEPCTAPCVETPAGEGSLGGGWGQRTVTAQLAPGTTAPVAPDTAYSYRVIARNEHGAAEAAGAFTTPPAAAPLKSGEPQADGRAFEMVSPPDKEGASVLAVGDVWGGAIQAAAEGGALAYTSNGPFAEPEGSRTVEDSQILSRRTPQGWRSKDITTPNSAGTGPTFGLQQEYDLFTPDLSVALLTPTVIVGGNMAQPPLAPPASTAEQALAAEGKPYQEKTPYLRDDAGIEPQGALETALYQEAQANGARQGNPGYLALVDGLDAPAGGFGGSVFVEGATRDLSHVVLQSEVPLRPGGSAGLYEWTAQPGGEAALKPVSLLPGGAPASQAVLGSGEPPTNVGSYRNLRGALSDDGSRVFWNSDGHLYMRATATPAGDPQTEETIQLDTPAGGQASSGEGGAVFQLASSDGSRVFFTDSEPLTPTSGAGLGQSDLYVCEIVETPSRQLECRLTDLTPAHEGEESADLAGPGYGGVLGASEDGAYVYFLANGVLAENANGEGEHATPGACDAGDEVTEGTHPTCNLYMEHYDAHTGGWGEPVFLARLAGAALPELRTAPGGGQEGGPEGAEGDEADWGVDDGHHGQGAMTARVSPDGRYLAFLSERELTGYDNHDLHSGQSDQELFLYQAPAGEQTGPGSLTCVSCDPSGEPPAGVHDPSIAETGPGHEGLLVDLNDDLGGKWLAASLPEAPGINYYLTQDLYQNRVLSDSGRLYFDSPADLVPAATNAKEDVYEYEPLGVPRGPHACTSASADYSPQAGGCIGLVSSGTAGEEAAFLDASEAGGEGEGGDGLQEGGLDVFFASTAKLVPTDGETTLSLYDAHECTSGSPCLPPEQTSTPEECETTAACRSYEASASLGAPTSAAPGAPGNSSAHTQVLPEHTEEKPKSKSLTRAQKLTAALKACKAKYRKAARKRVACEKTARKHYARPHKKKAKQHNGARKPGGRR